jgi:phage-related protein (TIGR01555 family)
MFTKAELLSARSDGWFNVLTGIGTASFDKRMSTSFGGSDILDDALLINLYRSEGLATRVIDIPVEDMVRNWFYVKSDTDDILIKALRKLKAKKAFCDALTWSDLFGGSVIFMGIDDGRAATEPVNEKLIRSIKFLEVYDKRQVQWDPTRLYTDKKNVKYGKPEIYKLYNVYTSETIDVHESRLLIFEGKKLPDQERLSNQNWGDSRLQSIYERLKGVCESLYGVETINTEFILGVLKVTNLQQLLSNNEGEQALHDRLKALDMTKNVLNTMVVDKNEEFTRETSIGVSGLRDLIDVLIDVLCGISGIPRVKLIGDQSKGLGGSAEGNTRMYYDGIAARQEFDLEPNILTILRYLALSKTTKYNGDPETIEVKFLPLWQATKKEEAETRLINSKSDAVYMDYGLPSEYVINSRFGGQSYGEEINLPPEYEKMLKSIPLEEALESGEENEEKDKKASIIQKSKKAAEKETEEE